MPNTRDSCFQRLDTKQKDCLLQRLRLQCLLLSVWGHLLPIGVKWDADLSDQNRKGPDRIGVWEQGAEQTDQESYGKTTELYTGHHELGAE